MPGPTPVTNPGVLVTWDIAEEDFTVWGAHGDGDSPEQGPGAGRGRCQVAGEWRGVCSGGQDLERQRAQGHPAGGEPRPKDTVHSLSPACVGKRHKVERGHRRDRSSVLLVSSRASVAAGRDTPALSGGALARLGPPRLFGAWCCAPADRGKWLPAGAQSPASGPLCEGKKQKVP